SSVSSIRRSSRWRRCGTRCCSWSSPARARARSVTARCWRRLWRKEGAGMTGMTERATCIDGAFLSRFPGIEFLPQMVRLLACGRPVALGEIADSGGISVEQIEAVLRGQPGCEWDEDGRLVGFGLTQRPTAHRLVLPTGTLYTWCAIDTLFFPLMLGAPATAESSCPATGRSIRVELVPDAAPSV